MRNGFLSYIVKRLLLGIVTLFVIMLASYALLRLAPGDPAKSSFLSESGAGKSGGTGTMTSDRNAPRRNKVIEEQLNLDKPIYVGFCLWMKDALHGDFGTSVAVDKGRSVTELIMERLPITLKLNVLAVILTYLLAIPVGIHSSRHPDSAGDKVFTLFLFFLYSLPVLWTALMLQACLCKGGLYPVFPLKGLTPDVPPGASTWKIMALTASHYVLPVFCLSYSSFAGLSRFTRAGMLEVVKQEFIRTARAKGLPESSVIYRHAFRNAIIIMITLFAGILPGLVAGSILIEYIFNIPGMGALSMLALSSRDVPLMMALFSFSSFLTLAGILLSDVLYAVADPRISFSSRA